MKRQGIKQSPAKSLALVGIMAASVECGKLALSFLPNVEVVSLLLALYSYVFGLYGVMAAYIFVCIEPIIWGFNTWVVSYLIYWPLLSILFFILGKLRVKNRILLTSAAVLMTFLFGVLTSLVDIGLLSGFFDNFEYRFAVYYARGAVFYIIHICSNAVIFLVLFSLFAKKLLKIKLQLFN